VIAGKQMPAAKELLERAEEHLDHPPQSIHLRDEFGRQVESIGDSRRFPALSRSVPTFRRRESSGRIFPQALQPLHVLITNLALRPSGHRGHDDATPIAAQIASVRLDNPPAAAQIL